LCFASPRCWIGAQPQRDVGWLYRLPNHTHQVVAQGVQIRLVSELGREGLQGLGCVVLAAVEAPVYESTTEGSSSLSALITLHAEIAVLDHHFSTKGRTPTMPIRHLISPLPPR
jgi:hypothetical protein